MLDEGDRRLVTRGVVEAGGDYWSGGGIEPCQQGQREGQAGHIIQRLLLHQPGEGATRSIVRQLGLRFRDALREIARGYVFGKETLFGLVEAHKVQVVLQQAACTAGGNGALVPLPADLASQEQGGTP